MGPTTGGSRTQPATRRTRVGRVTASRTPYWRSRMTRFREPSSPDQLTRRLSEQRDPGESRGLSLGRDCATDYALTWKLVDASVVVRPFFEYESQFSRYAEQSAAPL